MGSFWDDPIGNTVDATVQLGTGGMVGYDAESNSFGGGMVSDGISRATGIGQPQQSFQIDHTGKPKPMGYNSTLQGEGYENLKSTALNKGLNPWAALALARQKKMTNKNIEDAATRTASGTAQTEAKLASTGGLTSGARERTAQAGQKNYMDLVSNLSGQGETNAMNIGIADGENKSKLQQMLAQLQMGDIKDKNAYNENLYNQQMTAWAAEQQARATEDSGKK